MHGTADWVWALVLLAPIPLCRRRPAATAVFLSVIGLAHAIATDVDEPFVVAAVASLIGFYAAGAWAERAPAYAALAAGLAAFWTQDALAHHAPREFLASAILVGGTWGAGRALRSVRTKNRRLEELAQQLAREREARARDAVLLERARIAREMHDILGHALSVISLQSQAAAAALEHRPELVGPPLAAIDQATGTAMAELRRLVAVLDEDGEDGEARSRSAPTPSLGSLTALVEEHRASGLDVTLALAETPSGVSAGVQLAAYRIVQEGLTNVRRHSAARAARVGVRFAGDEAIVEVADDGPPAERGPTSARPGGHGLGGARARAAACGGWVEAGPDGGGWSLRATLPFQVAST